MKTPLYYLTPYFSNSVQHPHPVHPYCSFLPWLIGWSHHIWCVNLLNDIMDVHTLSFDTLVTEGPWFVFYTTTHQIYWGLTYNKVFCKYSDLISHTHKQRHKTHTGAKWLTHINKYILTQPVLCSQQPSVLHWTNNLLISKIYFRVTQCLCFSKITHLQKSHICW